VKRIIEKVSNGYILTSDYNYGTPSVTIYQKFEDLVEALAFACGEKAVGETWREKKEG